MRLRFHHSGLFALVFFCVLGSCSQAEAQSGLGTRAKEKKQVEAARTELQQKLKVLKKDISKTENAKERASDALEDSEQAISQANRAIYDLQTEQKSVQAQLDELVAEKKRLDAQLARQKNQLAFFLQQQYMHGDTDRVKLLLSGDNPNRINRQLQYMSYVSQMQAKMIAALNLSVDEIEKNRIATQETKDELDQIASEERDHKKGLEKEKKRHAALLQQLASKLKAQRKEAESLQKDEQRMNNLVGRLSRLIEEQAKAEEAQRVLAEKRRKEKAQRELAEKQGQKSSKAFKPVEEEKEARSDPVLSLSFNDKEGFGRLKGQLRLPVVGDLAVKFGTKRGQAPVMKGLFIKANEGSEVRTIAPGTVVNVQWMRGWGNIIVINHGGDFLSIYGCNQAVLKHQGDQVKMGEVIATAGNTGGNEESGLYFEMRHKGSPFDPMTWMRK